MGKREIGELSILDLVIFIMIAEMAVMAIEDTSKPMLYTVVPMVILVIIQISTAYLSLKSHKFREVVDGKPSILIDRGKINEKEMSKQRYNFDDLLVQLRDKDIRNVADVEFAILEPSGKLSVFEKEKEKNAAKDATNPNISTFPPAFPSAVITDGYVKEEMLEKIGKTNLWLRRELRALGYHQIKDISFCSIDENGNFFIDLKDE